MKLENIPGQDMKDHRYQANELELLILKEKWESH